MRFLKFWLLSYNHLLKNLVNFSVNVTVKPQYFLIKIKGTKFHISIYFDQWDYYHVFRKKYERLFHITDEELGCSRYYILDNKLRISEPANFKYEQDDFGYFKSTRKRCMDKSIDRIIKNFSRLINRIAHKLFLDYKKRNIKK